MVKHKLDDMVEIKNDFYKSFKGNEWCKGAGLYQVDKKNWCILALIKEENIKDVPDVWKGLDVKIMIVT